MQMLIHTAKDLGQRATIRGTVGQGKLPVDDALELALLGDVEQHLIECKVMLHRRDGARKDERVADGIEKLPDHGER